MSVTDDQTLHRDAIRHRGGFALWWCVVVGTAAVAWAMVVGSTSFGELDGIADVALILVTFLVITELRPIVASRRLDPDGVNLATAIHFAILLRWGIVPTLGAIALATITGELARRKPLHKAAFNVSQYSVSFLAAWGVLRLFGWEASPALPADLRPRDLLLVALAGFTYHVVNLGLVGTALALHAGTAWWSTTVDNVWWYTRTTMAVLAIGPLIVVVSMVNGGFLVLLVLPLWLVYAVAKLSLDREVRASTDSLTGLANRERLEHLLEERIAAIARSGRCVALCVVDLDRFKEVNDTLGHATGDALLRAVAARLSAAVREGDAVVRLGGDEFVLLLEVDDRAVASAVVERIAVHVHRPYDLAGVRLEVSMSVGVALLGEDGDDLDTLMRRADVAMYDAKAIRRDRARLPPGARPADHPHR